jgi:polysaccharide biosynthesis protein PelC
MFRIVKTLSAAALSIILAGCAATQHYLSPEADLPYYERVAVIPFTSLSQDRLAGDRVASIFVTELLSQRVAEVVDPGQFAASMREVRGGTPFTNPWSAADLARLGETSRVQGIFLGTVREYEMSRAGRESFPLISMEIHMVDAASGRIVWSASRTRKGGPSFPLFGWTEVHTLGELSASLCSDMLRTLK